MEALMIGLGGFLLAISLLAFALGKAAATDKYRDIDRTRPFDKGW